MSVPHSRRLPIPNIFRADSSSSMANTRKSDPRIAEGHNSDSQHVSAVNAPRFPQDPSARRHFILPAPSEKNVKYVPFTRGSKPNYSKPYALPTNDQNVPVFQVPASPAQTSEASGESTLVASTPTSWKIGLEESDTPRLKVFVEKTNSVAPEPKSIIHDDTAMNEAETSPFPPSLNKHDDKYVLTATSDSSNGLMNHNVDTAHLETAASLRSIRSTLDQLRKKRSSSRTRKSQAHSTIEDAFKDLSVKSIKSFADSDVSQPQIPETETVSDLVSQLLNIIRSRRCPDHKGFMAKWSAIEYKGYNNRWNKLLKSVDKPRRDALRFTEIPWPVLPALVTMTPYPLLITRENLTRFLICPHGDDQHSSCQKVSDEIDRWNNLAIMDSILKNVREVDRKRVQEAWSRVVIVLMEMRGEYSAN